MATSTRTRKGATRSNSTPEFEILDSPPNFRTAPGRDKSPLRRQIEALKPGQFLVADRLSDVVGEGDTEEERERDAERQRRNRLAAVRQKTQGVKGVKYGVRRDEDDRVIVFVKANDDGDDSDDDA